MSNQWYYTEDGAQYGPVDEAEIVRLIQDGELPIGTPVLQEGHMDWHPARDHACFQVEIYPKKKRESVQAAAQDSFDDVKFYEQVDAELEGDNLNRGLWLKAKTKAGSDAEKATSLYTEWRVKQLLEEEARLLSEGKKAPVKAFRPRENRNLMPHPVRAPAKPASKTPTVKTSQPTRQTTAQPTAKPSSPVVTTAVGGEEPLGDFYGSLLSGPVPFFAFSIVALIVAVVLLSGGDDYEPTFLLTQRAERTVTPTSTSWVSDPDNVIIEERVRRAAGKPTGELTTTDLASVTHLYLIGAQITDAGLKEIAKLQQLTFLYLFDTEITDAGAAELQEALPKCTIFR